MNETVSTVLTVGVLVLALVASYRPLGDWMTRVYTSPGHSRAELLVYRAIGVDPEADQRWFVYLRALLAFSAVSILALYALMRLQASLPLSLGLAAVPPGLAWNTAVSFVTNTNWQNYSGESTMGHLVQMSGLAVQNFASAAVGMAVAVALVRGFVRSESDRVGNFWVDLVRTVGRILLPIALVSAVVLLAGGVIQNLDAPHVISTLTSGSQNLPGGPVASQEAIKQLGTNGGGFFNANSAHPFENPNPFTNLFAIYLLLLIPFSLPRTFGALVGDHRQGYAIAAAMSSIFLASVAVLSWAELSGFGTAAKAAGAAMEGKEQRFGVGVSAVFASATTLTSTGAVDASHDSLTSFGGGVALLDMMTGEVAPGGTGSGLYGMLVAAVIAVFIAGLMVGRTPEYLGKKLQGRQITLASLYILATPMIVLSGVSLAIGTSGQRAAMLNSGPHGFSEILYAFTSMGNNNGSAFAGLGANTPWYNTVGGLAMLFGRFLPIVLVLALAGSLAGQRKVPATSGTLATYQPIFIVLLIGVVLLVTSLTYLPALALGPLAEGLH